MFSLRVRKALGAFQLDASFDAAAKSVTALYGPSGAGKTTIANIIAGLVKPDEGRLILNGRVLFDSAAGVNLPPERRRVGCVFQDGRLFPHLKVRANLRYGLRLLKPGQRRLREEEVVELMGIGHLLERRPATLSGGEKQRVGVGRALLASPELLLMDEPLASLDRERKDEVLPFLARLPRKLDLPIIYVSHSWREISFLGARVVRVAEGRTREPEPSRPPDGAAAKRRSAGRR